MTEATQAGPSVWLLTDDRPGNRTQAIGVARALGRPYEEKRLVFGKKAKRAVPLLGATLDVLDEASRAAIAPPWPDLLLATGRRAVPVARYVKRESAGRTRVALIGRRTPGAFADLIIRCAYFRQAPDPKLLELVLPPTQVDQATLAAARASQPDPMAGLAHPRCVALVGGPTGAHVFDAGFAGEMARKLAAAAQAAGASLAIVTSPRTPAAAIAAMRAAAPDALLHEWRRGAVPNPFMAFLAGADLLVVTGESESMLAEAAATAKPLTIVPLAEEPLDVKQKIRAWIAKRALGSGLLAPLARRIMLEGWVMPRRDLADLHEAIEAHGWGRVFDGTLNTRPPKSRDEDRAVRERLEALLAAPLELRP